MLADVDNVCFVLLQALSFEFSTQLLVSIVAVVVWCLAARLLHTAPHIAFRFNCFAYAADGSQVLAHSRCHMSLHSHTGSTVGCSSS
jgi:hypothetical protein